MAKREEKTAQRRKQIIEGALTCFIRRGFNNTTMDEIAVEAGVSKGSLYWYFESKDELFQEAVSSIFEGFGEKAFTGLADCETAEDKLWMVGRSAARMGEIFEGYFSLLLEFWVSSSKREEAGLMWGELLNDYAGVLAMIIEGGMESGEFREVNAGELAWSLLAAYDGLAAYQMFVPGLDIDRISETLIGTILKGLKKDSSR
jgi:AcrR family transcriptional regulator